MANEGEIRAAKSDSVIGGLSSIDEDAYDSFPVLIRGARHK